MTPPSLAAIRAENAAAVRRQAPWALARVRGGCWRPDVWTACVLVAAALSVQSAPAAPGDDAPTEPAELKNLRMEYQQRLLKARAPADDWYRMQLRALHGRYRQAANVTALLGIESELMEPGSWIGGQASNAAPAELRSLYQTYVAQCRRLTEPVDTWYRAQLGTLRSALIREGRLADATSIEKALASDRRAPGMLAPQALGDDLLRPDRWVVPHGGRFSLRDSVLTLTGPGDLPFRMTVSLSKIPLEDGTKIDGEMEITGGGGLVLGADSSLGKFIFISTSPEGTRVFEVVQRNARVVTVVSDRRQLNAWIPFELQRAKDAIRVRFGADRTSIPLDGRYGDKWGMITSEANVIRLRSIRIQRK